MADVPGVGVQDFGNLLTSFGQGTANMNATNASAAETQAKTGLVNQQAQAAAMQNKIMQARMPVILKALADYNTQSDDGGTGGSGNPQATPGTAGSPLPQGGAPTQPAEEADEDNWYDPARVDAGLRQRYFVDPTGTSQEKKNLVGAALSGDPGLLEAAKQLRQNGVDSRLAHSQNDANELYETMTNGVVNAPEGRALDALEAISPQAATQIRKLIPDEMDEDAAARKFATHVANTVHQYSGREVVADTGGTYRDKVTGMPLAGGLPAGMNQDQLAQLAAKGNELVTVKQSDGSEVQVHRYLAEGAKTLKQWELKVLDKASLPNASPTITGAPKAALHDTLNQVNAKAPVPPGNGTAPPQAPQQPVPNAPGNMPKQPAITPGGPLAIALQDRSFRSPIATKPVTTGVSQNAMDKGDVETYQTQKRDLMQETGEKAGAASQALASFRAAKAIMDAPDGSNIAGVIPGAFAAEMAKLGLNTDTGAHRLEAAKYLTNGALQNLKQVYGGKPGVFDVKVNLEQAFPNIGAMNDQSVKNLIDSQIRQNQYTLDSAKRVPAFLAAKNEPYRFNDWNEQYFNRSNAVNEGAGKADTKSPAKAEYKTPEAVKAAYAAGKITREQAKQILQQQHGMN